MVYKSKRVKNIFKFIRNKLSINRFKKKILSGSPSFGLLWKMADFIKSAEIIFFYNNSTNNTEIGLYSSRKYPSGQNGFRVTTADITITIKLISESKRVMVEICRASGYNNTFAFANEFWDQNYTEIDELTLDRIISIINSRILLLFEWCCEKM